MTILGSRTADVLPLYLPLLYVSRKVSRPGLPAGPLALVLAPAPYFPGAGVFIAAQVRACHRGRWGLAPVSSAGIHFHMDAS